MKNLLKCQETIIIPKKKLLDYLHHKKYCKIIGRDLQRQRKYEYSSTN